MRKVLVVMTVIFGIISLLIIGYWLFIGTGMTLNKGKFCAQILTDATNPISGVTKTFGNPCMVPAGWSKSNQL